jgi:hypothetical protein
MPAQTPTVSYGDSYTIGRVAEMWDKPAMFVRRMISEDKLVANERSLITNSSLRDFYAEHSHELD